MYNEIVKHESAIAGILQELLKDHDVIYVQGLKTYVFENKSTREGIILNDNFFIMNKSIRSLLDTLDNEVKMIETMAGELENYYDKLVNTFYIVLKNKLIESVKIK